MTQPAVEQADPLVGDDAPLTVPEERVVTVGVTDDILESLDGLVLNTDDLAVGGLLGDIDVTIIGLDRELGGETRLRDKNDPSSSYVTPEALVIQLRVDNALDIGLEADDTRQRLTLPKQITGRDGNVRRQKPSANGAYGIWLSTLQSLGVSAKPEEASVYHFTGLRDLIGLQYHRVMTDFASFDGRTFQVAVPTEIYGIDNELRASLNLPPKYLVGQEPTTPAKK